MTTTAITQEKRFCRYQGIMCEYATDMGCCKITGCAKVFSNLINEFYRTMQVLDELPSAQPEIIRCKDCKYYVVHTMFGRSEGWCERNCDEVDKLLAYVTEPDDFCSHAERRTDE